MPNILLNKRGCTIHCIRYFLADRIIVASRGLNPCLTNSKFSLSLIFIYFVFLFRLANCQSLNIPLPSPSRAANKCTIDRSAIKNKNKKKTYLKYLTNPFPLVTPRNNYLE
jgi:hypothetical protein